MGPRGGGEQAGERAESKSNFRFSNTFIQTCNQCLRTTAYVVCLNLPASGSK